MGEKQRESCDCTRCQTFAVTSEKSPLVLLHGATFSGRIWQDIVPLLSEHHDVHAPTLLGHRGGPAIQRRAARVSDMVDAAERYLDEHGLARPHLAGNSLGGWVAIELARRGRAASVCAFSPAGFWWDSDSHEQVLGQIRRKRARRSPVRQRRLCSGRQQSAASLCVRARVTVTALPPRGSWS